MKKILSLLLIAVASLAHAAIHVDSSFLNARMVQATNTIGVTNLASITSTVTTNALGTVYTNLANARVVVTGSTNSGVNLLRTVALPKIKGFVTPIYTNQAPGAALMAGPYIGSIFVRVRGGSGANTAATFTFAPVPSLALGVDHTTAADLITVSVTPNGTSDVTSLTKVDAQKLIGCEGLMLRTIVAGDTDASSNLEVLECRFEGFDD